MGNNYDKMHTGEGKREEKCSITDFDGIACNACAFVVVLLIVSKLESFCRSRFSLFSMQCSTVWHSCRVHTAKLCHSSFVCLYIAFSLFLYLCICCFFSLFECPFQRVKKATRKKTHTEIIAC